MTTTPSPEPYTKIRADRLQAGQQLYYGQVYIYGVTTTSTGGIRLDTDSGVRFHSKSDLLKVLNKN